MASGHGIASLACHPAARAATLATLRRTMTELAPIIATILPEIRRLRRELHAHPELGYTEFETARRVAAWLEPLPGFSLRKNVAATGIVAVLDAGKTGPCVALRADMDALPITEQTGVAHASQRPGLMHACGHDGHTAALVGAALVLARIRDQLRGPVKFLFQPAEEGGAGGKRMIEERALEDPPVAAIFGAHNMPTADLQLGEIGLRPGPFMGGGMNFFIDVHGRGGHAAAPHTTIDPIYVGAQIVNALQSLVSRATNPLEPLVVTVGSFHSGTATNIVPDSARIEGTARALSPQLLEEIPERLGALVRGIAAAHGATASVEFRPGYPVTVNDARAAAFVAEVAAAAAGRENVRADYAPILGSEDFSFYLRARPGCFYFLGTRPADQPEAPLCHSPRFDFNDDALPLAIAMHCELARRFAANWAA